MSTPAPVCPACGEPYEPGQLVCLRCGGRLGLTPPRPDRRRTLTALALAIVALGGIVLGFALNGLTDGDDAGGQQASQAQRAEQVAQLRRQHAAAERRDRLAQRRRAREKARQQAQSGTWPSGLRAYTVVLVTAGDEAAARQTADGATEAGLKAGVLRSDDYGLGQGFWIVYSGSYTDADQAAAEADTLGDKYPGAYPQLIEPSSG